ncbi:energy-coupling factor transporter ATP-binding protein EcfA2 [Methanolobus bombayensis]|nr:energy-coupling factor transporter ATP-binding protein EcfA2 [Methanolobus bombayensis]
MKHEDVVMEHFTAEDKRPLDKCLEAVASCDLYIGIFAWRYGYIPPGENRSITELEYRKAQDAGIECLIFLVDKKTPWSPENMDLDKPESMKKLASLKQELSEKHQRDTFSSIESLESKVATAVHNWKRDDLEFRDYSNLDINRYATAVHSKYNVLDMDTLTPSTKDDYVKIQLQSIFIEQKVRENLPPTELPKEIAGRIQEEWDFDEECFSCALKDFDFGKANREYYSKPSLPVLDVVTDKKNKHIVILGDPGSGKSSLSKYMLLSILGHKEDPKLKDIFEGYIPLLIELRDFIGLYSEQKCDTFLEYFKHLGKTQGYSLNEKGLHSILSKEDRSIVIFDGLDEIFDPNKWERVNNMIVGFTLDYPKTRVIVTSRIVGYNKNRLSNAGFKHFTIQDFDDVQISAFLDKWCSVAFFENRETSEIKKNRVLRALEESNSIHQLAGNPLLLTILAIIGKHQELPRERSELFSHAAGILIEHWDVNRHLKNENINLVCIDKKDKIELLRRIAFSMQSSLEGLAGNLIHREQLTDIIEEYLICDRLKLSNSDAKIVAKSIIEQFRKRNFILCLYGADYFGFIHRTFLEYFCADAIVDKFNNHKLNVDSLKQFYSENWEKETWHEVLRLICGIKDNIAGELIEHLINVYNPRHNGSRSPWNIVLAIKCLSEVRALETVDKSSEDLLYRIFGLFEIARHDSNIEIFLREEIVPSTKTVGTNWPNRNLLVDWIYKTRSFDNYNDYSLSNTWAEFVIYIGHDSKEVCESIQNKLRDQRKSKYLAILTLHKHTLKNKTICANIKCILLNDKHAIVRKSAVDFLAKHWNDDLEVFELIINAVRNDMSSNVRRASIRTLAEHWNDDLEVFPLIMEAARNDKSSSLRRDAIRTLAEYWTDNSEVFLFIMEAARNNENFVYIRQISIEIMAEYWNDDLEVFQFIKDAARDDKSWRVRRTAIEKMTEYWNDDSDVFQLIKEAARNDKSWRVRKTAIEKIAEYWNDNSEVFQFIMEAARNNENYNQIRTTAIENIAEYWNDDLEVFQFIKEEARYDKSNSVRGTAIRTLAKYWNDDSGVFLFIKGDANTDKSSSVRGAAIRTLAKYWNDNSGVFQFIKEDAKNDKSSSVRKTAIRTLAEYWNDDSIVLELIKEAARSDRNWRVRGFSIETLAKYWNNDSGVFQLIKEDARNDKLFFHIRRIAIETLAKYWNDDSEVFRFIKEDAGSDKSSSVRSTVIETLAKYWNNDSEIFRFIMEAARSDKNNDVRSTVIETLAKYWNDDSEVFQFIMEAAKSDKINSVRGTAIRTLAGYWNDNSEVFQFIKENARNDINENIRETAIRTLVKYWNDDSEIFQFIKEVANNDKSSSVREAARRTLVER